MHKNIPKVKRNALRNDMEKLKHILSITAHDMSDQAKLALQDSYDNVKDKSVDLEDSVVNYVNHKPFKALGIAVFTGLVLGLAMHKKRKHHNSHR